jgi:hypothetical protein
MEDPERLRTRIRLDLDEVRSRIEEMEEMIESDKRSADSSTLSYNMEELRQLYQYEKKLKQQYEQIAGIRLDAADLRGFGVTEKKGISFGSKIFASIMALIISLNFANVIVHGIWGFTPNDMIGFYLGNVDSMPALWIVFDSMTDSDSISNYISIAYLALIFVSSLILISIIKTKSKLFRLLEYIGLVAPSGYLLYLITIEANTLARLDADNARAAFFVDNLLYFGIIFAVSGVFILLAAIKRYGALPKLLTFIASGLYFASAYFVLNIELFSTTKEMDSLYNWPYIYLPMYILGYVYILIALFIKSR